jgi:hypothetical protein
MKFRQGWLFSPVSLIINIAGEVNSSGIIIITDNTIINGNNPNVP